MYFNFKYVCGHLLYYLFKIFMRIFSYRVSYLDVQVKEILIIDMYVNQYLITDPKVQANNNNSL